MIRKKPKSRRGDKRWDSYFHYFRWELRCERRGQRGWKTYNRIRKVAFNSKNKPVNF